MQFGRIDANAYTLDFQYPLTAIQVMVMVMMIVIMMVVMMIVMMMMVSAYGMCH